MGRLAVVDDGLQKREILQKGVIEKRKGNRRGGRMRRGGRWRYKQEVGRSYRQKEGQERVKVKPIIGKHEVNE